MKLHTLFSALCIASFSFIQTSDTYALVSVWSLEENGKARGVALSANSASDQKHIDLLAIGPCAHIDLTPHNINQTPPTTNEKSSWHSFWKLFGYKSNPPTMANNQSHQDEFLTNIQNSIAHLNAGVSIGVSHSGVNAGYYSFGNLFAGKHAISVNYFLEDKDTLIQIDIHYTHLTEIAAIIHATKDLLPDNYEGVMQAYQLSAKQHERHAAILEQIQQGLETHP